MVRHLLLTPEAVKRLLNYLIGLMVFAFLLFADNLVAAYMYFDLAKAYGPPVAAPLLVINVIGVLGFATLLWTTMR